MKCWVFLVDREQAQFYKRCTYEANIGKIKKRLGFKIFKQFAIPDNVSPIRIQMKRNKSIPVFIVNQKTWIATGMALVETTNPEMDEKLNTLLRKEYLEATAKKVKISLGDKILLMLAGFGLFGFIGFIVLRLMGALH